MPPGKGGIPDRFCMDAASFLVSHQPVLFIIASTLAFYDANPFRFLVTVLSIYDNLSALSGSVKCLHVSVIHISLLSYLGFPSLPVPASPSHSPSLWQDESESLRAFIMNK